MNEPLLAPSSRNAFAVPGQAASPEQRRQILRERAARLAEPPKPVTLPEGLSVTSFSVAGSRYAVETSFVSEVFLLDEITAVPGTPSFLAGVVNRRGLILALFDLKALLHLPVAGITDIHAVIVLHSENAKIGLLADQLLGGALFPLKPRESSALVERSEYVRGVAPDGLILLDAGLILSDDRLLVNACTAGGGSAS